MAGAGGWATAATAACSSILRGKPAADRCAVWTSTTDGGSTPMNPHPSYPHPWERDNGPLKGHHMMIDTFSLLQTTPLLPHTIVGHNSIVDRNSIVDHLIGVTYHSSPLMYESLLDHCRLITLSSYTIVDTILDSIVIIYLLKLKLKIRMTRGCL